MNELGDLLRVSSLQGVEVRELVAHRLDETVNDAAGAFGAEGRVQDTLGVVDAAAHEVFVGHRQLVKILQGFLSLVGCDGFEFRNLAAYLLHFLLGEETEHFRRDLVAERHDGDGGLAETGEDLIFIFRVRDRHNGSLVFVLVNPRSQQLNESVGILGGGFFQMLLENL